MEAHTVLHQWHLDHGARMAPFAGWDMPLHYAGGALAEHQLCRESAGLFDICHMGRLGVRGKGARAFLGRLVSSDVAGLAPGLSMYGLLLNESGGVIDDLFVYCLDADDFLVVVNASNKDTDLALFRAQAGDGVQVEDLSASMGMVALQGPRAMEVADALLGGSGRPSELPRLGAGRFLFRARPLWAGRTGYTGEDGLEIYPPADMVEALWDEILVLAGRLGVTCGPVGLAARDSLRFEAGMPLHGHEIGPDISPLESGLGWALSKTSDYAGRTAVEALRAAGCPRRLATLVVQGGVPRAGYPVLDGSGRVVGRCVSGMFCPTAKVFAATALVETNCAIVGTPLQVEARGKDLAAMVQKGPLVVPSWKRSAR